MAVKLEDIQKSIDAINKSLNSNQGKITADAKEYVKQFKSAEQAAKNLELTMRGIRQEQLEMSTGLNELRDRFADIGKELNNQDNPGHFQCALCDNPTNGILDIARTESSDKLFDINYVDNIRQFCDTRYTNNDRCMKIDEDSYTHRG